MAARAPPAAGLALDVGFHKIEVSPFDGTNFEDYGFTLKTALTSWPCPAAVAILLGDLTRPLTSDASDIFPHKTGISMHESFCAGRETYSTGVLAISIPCSDPAYGAV